MNLPNKLTILRTLMIPVFLFFLLTDCAGDYSKWIAVVVFILASLTDFLDGHIARKYNLVTNDRISWNAPFIIYRSDHYYCKRIYH